MNTRHFTCALMALFSLTLAASAQPNFRLLPPVISTALSQGKDKEPPVGKEKDKEKKLPEKKLTDAPDTDFFTRAPTPIRDALGYNPHMLGDFSGVFARTRVNVPGTSTQTVTTVVTQITPGPPTVIATNTATTTAAVTGQRTALVPVPNFGAFKVAENASPMPIDRVFFTYNYYNALRYPGAQRDPITLTQTRVVQTGDPAVQTTTTTTTTTTVLAGSPIAHLHREVFGFEKTFFDGRASVEMRLPIYQQTGSLDEFRAEHMGDLTINGKYAFYLNPTSGDVFSGGMAVTVPTGPGIDTIDGHIHSTLFQPWVGYIYNVGLFYVHAFHSAVLPTDNRDVTLLFNDVGLGAWLYRGDGDRALRFVVPTVEAHVTTPLNNRGDNDAFYAPDLVVLTGGVHVGIGRASILTFGVGAPVSGPNIYTVEAFVQFNRRF